MFNIISLLASRFWGRRSVAFHLVLIISAVCCWSCMKEEPVDSVELTASPEAPQVDIDRLIEEGIAQEVTVQPSLIRETDGHEVGGSAVRAAYTDITFSDPDALALIPNWKSTFVTWPGYIQKGGNGFMYIWMSHGPGSGNIPYTEEGPHYHLLWDDFCINPNTGEGGIEGNGTCLPTSTDPNLDIYHGAMFGTDWLYGYAQKSGVGKANFDLTRIRVKSEVPILLTFKDADGKWWYWKELKKGYWNLGKAENIQEFYIRATSNLAGDQYSVDDIRIDIP